MLINSIKFRENIIKYPVCLKNDLLIQQKCSAEIDFLSYQRNHSLNIFLTENVSNNLVSQQKKFAMVIQREIEQIYGDFTGI